MNNHTLAETLREWVELDSTIRAASDACADAQNRAKKLSWDRTVVAARDYLRGYDDATREQIREQIVDNHALASENDELKHRVQELEAQVAELRAGRDPAYTAAYEDVKLRFEAKVRELETIAACRNDQDGPFDAAQPAAVGVVGAVKYGVLCVPRNYAPYMNNAVYSTHEAAYRAWGHEPDMYRVVAIVDPDAIVPLASAEPVRWIGTLGRTYHTRVDAVSSSETIARVVPLHEGLAQPAQERDA
jgi:hypothetical protein